MRTKDEIERRRAINQILPPKKPDKPRRPALTEEQIDARMTAFEEAALHLEQAWSDSDEEHRQGLIVADWIRNQAENWLSATMNRRR